MPSWFKEVDYANEIPDLAISKSEYGARYLVPKNNKAAATYNVHKDFCWTLSNPKTRSLIPRVKLTEYRLKYSAELLSYINSARGFQEALGRLDVENPLAQLALGAGAIAGGEAFLGQLTNTAAGIASRLPGPLGRLARATLTGSAAEVKAGKATIAKIFGGAAAAAGTTALGAYAYSQFSDPSRLKLEIDKSRGGKDALDPYSNLYSGIATKISYILPYISIDNMTGINSSWTEPGKNAPITNLLEQSRKMIGKGSGGAAALGGIDLITSVVEAAALGGEPGAGREKIKGYSPPESGDSITLTFYLFNTISIEQTQNNWEFLYVLTYQNLPNRRGINLLDPPCIYEIEVPGYKRFPVANIEKLTVTNEGTTRYIDLATGNTVPPESGPNVKLIPEAYKVTLTIRSLLTTTQNLFGWADGETIVQVFKAERAEQDPSLNASGVTQRQIREDITGGAGSPVSGGGTVVAFIPRGGFPNGRFGP